MIEEQSNKSLQLMTMRDHAGKGIHQLFEFQASLTPDSIAVRFEQAELTYRELNERSNQLAHQLINRGVKPEDLVGLCVERSLEMIVGLLGILKAGAAYVPFDPYYPKERLRFLFEDAQVAILLTQRHLLEKLPDHKAQTVYLDQVSHSSESVENPRTDVESQN